MGNPRRSAGAFSRGHEIGRSDRSEGHADAARGARRARQGGAQSRLPAHARGRAGLGDAPRTDSGARLRRDAYRLVERWPNDAAMQNRDAAGIAHYPGWSMPVLKLLYEQRHIAASGHETTD